MSDVRAEEQSLESLAESIKLHGVIQPIRVRPAEDGETFIIIAGERRWRASRIAGLATIPCTIAEGPACDPKEVAAAQLVENIHREGLTPVQIATHLERLIVQHKMVPRDLPAYLGRSGTWVSRHRAVLKADGPAKQALDEKYLNSADAFYLFTKLAERDQMRLLKQARKDKLAISRATIERALASAQGRAAEPPSDGANPRKAVDMICLPSITRSQCEQLFSRLRLPVPPADPDEISTAFLLALSE